jgi:hypothetical protein
MQFLSKKKNYETKMIIENIKEFMQVQIAADPQIQYPLEIIGDLKVLSTCKLYLTINSSLKIKTK